MDEPNPNCGNNSDKQDLIPNDESLISPFAFDPDLFPLVSNFIQGLPQEIAALSEEIAANNHKNVATLSHRLRGTAATYGYPQLASLIHELENFALTDKISLSSSDQVSSVLEKIRIIVALMEQALRERFQNSTN